MTTLNITRRPRGITKIDSPSAMMTIRIERCSDRSFHAELEDLEDWWISKDKGDDYKAEECTDGSAPLPTGFGETESEALEALLHSIPLYLQWLQGNVDEITPVIEARIEQLKTDNANP